MIAAVIFALPAPVRLTQLGIESVPAPLLEAAARSAPPAGRC